VDGVEVLYIEFGGNNVGGKVEARTELNSDDPEVVAEAMDPKLLRFSDAKTAGAAFPVQYKRN